MSKASEQRTRREQQRVVERELARRLVDIGYKVLANQLHPDKGGSSEQMARLNRARKHLKDFS